MKKYISIRGWIVSLLEETLYTLIVIVRKKEIFNVEFVNSELSVGKYRIDSLCYDEENGSLVIIEYKKGS